MCVITIQKNQIMVEQYEEVVHVTAKDIKLRMKHQQLQIIGEDLKVLALSKDEMLIEGTFEGLLFHEEN